MKRIEFLIWAGKHGWKHGQRYLQKAYNHFYDKGKIPDPKVILQKAKNYYDNFEGFKPTAVPKKGMFDNIFTKMYKEVMGPPKVVKPKLKIEKSKQIIEGMKPKAPKVVNIGDRIIKQMQKEGKTVKFDDLLRIYGKKPPHLKADGGRIDKALPGRSRDI